MCFTILQNEKTPFYAIKTRSSKSRKIDIFSKRLTHGFGPKMALFPTFFWGNIGQVNVFYDILHRKNAFVAYKNKKFKKSKIDIFPKGLTHGFGLKMAVFPTFIFQAIQSRKMSFTRFQSEKTPYQAIKKRSSNGRKIVIFANVLTHGFGLKMALFSTFFLGNIAQENVFYDIVHRRNAFLAYKKKKFKNSIN